MSDAPQQGGNQPDEQDRKRKRRILIVLGLLGLAGYACLAWAGLGGRPTGRAARPEQSMLSRMTGVPLEEVSLRTGAWDAAGVVTLSSGCERVLVVAERTSRFASVRSLGLRVVVLPAPESQKTPPPKVQAIYEVDDPHADPDLAPRLTGRKNAVDFPRKAQEGDQPQDLLEVRMPLLMCAGTVTITNHGDGAVRLELF